MDRPSPVRDTFTPNSNLDLDELKRHQHRAEVVSRWRDVQRAMGRRYASRTFDEFQCCNDSQRAVKSRFVNHCEHWPDNRDEGHGVFAFGPCGTGKDLLLSAGLRYVVSKFLAKPMWADGQTLFAKMRDVIGSDESESSVIAKYTSADILLLSDPVSGNADRSVTDFQQSTLWRIVDRRYRDLRPTWITINVANEFEAIARIGAPLVDRLIDGALCLKFDWPSARKPLA